MKLAHLVGGVIGGSPSTPVILYHLQVGRQATANQIDFPLQIVQVGSGHIPFLGDDDVAAAERAAVLAERQMGVERHL